MWCRQSHESLLKTAKCDEVFIIWPYIAASMMPQSQTREKTGVNFLRFHSEILVKFQRQNVTVAIRFCAPRIDHNLDIALPYCAMNPSLNLLNFSNSSAMPSSDANMLALIWKLLQSTICMHHTPIEQDELLDQNKDKGFSKTSGKTLEQEEKGIWEVRPNWQKRGENIRTENRNLNSANAR
jgi:hypothetical protein